jgi:hypothetical protein
VSGLESRLARLEAHESARHLLAEYARCCDANDASAVSELFDTDGTLHVGDDPVQGRTAIADWYRPRLSGATKHLVTNTMFFPSNRTDEPSTTELTKLTLRSEFVAIVVLDTGPSHTWGTYVDTVQVLDGRARFLDRTIEINGRSGPLTVVRT